MKEKPFIVQLAEFLSGYSGNSKELDETLINLRNKAEALNEELNIYKTQSEEFSAKVFKKQQEIERLEDTIKAHSNKLEILSDQLNLATENNKNLEDKCATLNHTLEFVSDKQNILVGYIMSAIQNSEIFSGELFSKEQVIQFLNAQFEQLLSTLDIEVFEDSNIPVNPVFHKIEATLYCDDITKEGFISRSLGKGFRSGQKCIQEQPVEIYTHNV